MSSADFAARFGRAIFDNGGPLLPPDQISQYGWLDWANSPENINMDDPSTTLAVYTQRQQQARAHLAATVDWSALVEADFDIGWWRKFSGTFNDADLVQLIKVSLPLRDGTRLAWAAEMTLAFAVQKTCTDMTFRDKYDY